MANTGRLCTRFGDFWTLQGGIPEFRLLRHAADQVHDGVAMAIPPDEALHSGGGELDRKTLRLPVEILDADVLRMIEELEDADGDPDEIRVPLI